MLTELQGKGGRMCESAMTGKLRCPLIVRSTSEDVITGELFETLWALNPRWWLPQLLNQALGSDRFRQQVFRGLEIKLWQNKPKYPRELLPWEEGSTQVDVTMHWRNPPTTVYFEMKYGSDLSTGTAGNKGDQSFPADQLIRNIRVGLLECGYFDSGSLFGQTPSDFVVVVVSPRKGHELVGKYREVDQVLAGIPCSDRLRGLPALPFIGEIDYGDIVRLLRKQRRWFSRAERVLVDQVTEYLEFKLSRIPEASATRQADLTFSTPELSISQ